VTSSAGRAPGTPASSPRRSPGRRHRWDLAALLLVVVGLALRVFVLSRSWWWQDDFAIADSASRADLSAAWLLQDYNGHLEPAKLLLVWVGMRAAPMSWAAASAVMLLWYLVYGAAFWALARRLFGPGPAALLGLALAVLCPLWALPTSWFASITEVLPTSALGLVSAWCLARLATGGRWWWGALCVAAFVGALSWHEKAALGVLLLAFVVAVLHLSGARPLRRRAVLVTLGAVVLVVAAYAAAYLWLIGGVPSSPATGEQVLELVRDLALSFVPTGLVGGPWQTGESGTSLQPLIGQPWLLWIWIAVLVPVVLGFRRHRAAAVIAVAAVALWLAVDVALLARARLGTFGIDVARDPRYVVDLVPIAGLALAALIAGGGRQPAPRVTAAGRRVLTSGAVMLALLYGAIAWPSWFGVAESRAAVDAQGWVGTALSEIESSPERVIADGLVPPRISLGIFGDTARVSRVLGLFGAPAARFGQPSTDWWVVRGDGRLAPSGFTVEAGGPVGSIPGCGIALRGRPVRVGIPAAPQPRPGQTRAVRLSYYSSAPATLVVDSGAERAELDLAAGLGYAYLPSDGSGGSLTLGGLGPDQVVCIATVEIGSVG
jgi:hypothetical protein